MEQARRLRALEKRLDAIDAARREDRDAYGKALHHTNDALYRLRRAVVELRERVTEWECTRETTGSGYGAGSQARSRSSSCS